MAKKVHQSQFPLPAASEPGMLRERYRYMKHFEVVAAVFIKDNRVFCAQRKDSGKTAKK